MSITLDDGTILALGRRFRSAVDRFDTLDERFVAADDDAPDKLALAVAGMDAEHERERLFRAVFRRQPANMADVAVLAAHSLHVVRDLENAEPHHAISTGTLADRLDLLATALAAIVAYAAPAGGADLCSIGWPDLPRIVRCILARRA